MKRGAGRERIVEQLEMMRKAPNSFMQQNKSRENLESLCQSQVAGWKVLQKTCYFIWNRWCWNKIKISN
ncbi:hypothetical protein AS859_11650 [Aliarcobacter cryaerophilus]|uniref:Uncharacterized protein n=1 Tax=Aliarcobacter cryaerophilus TaxID=28198 RepID=A0A1V9V946_9BACT|nr:hypothetical protein AS859_11650 [Aliarcobacter cryaerophilus]